MDDAPAVALREDENVSRKKEDRMSTTETPVLDLIAEMTAASIEKSELDPKSLMMVRLAALVAVDAPPASYLTNLAAAGDLGLEASDVQQVMIGIAPVVGTARVVSAAGKIARALGIAIAAAEAELEDEEASAGT
jgi:hypothetical protein